MGGRVWVTWSAGHGRIMAPGNIPQICGCWEAAVYGSHPEHQVVRLPIHFPLSFDVVPKYHPCLPHLLVNLSHKLWATPAPTVLGDKDVRYPFPDQ